VRGRPTRGIRNATFSLSPSPRRTLGEHDSRHMTSYSGCMRLVFVACLFEFSGAPTKQIQGWVPVGLL
jgi:hypothetical protein